MTQDNFFESEITHTPTWAEIILPLAVPVVYTYEVPAKYIEKAIPGCRAEVIFGKVKKYAGLIKSISTKEPAYKTKSIQNVLDDEPILFNEQLRFWNWMSSYYMCSEGEVMAAALPTNFKLSSETILIYNEEYGEDFIHLSHDEFLVAEALLIKKQLYLTEVQQVLDSAHVYPVVKKLLEKNVCFAWEKLQPKFKIKTDTYVLLNSQYQSEEKLAELLNQWKGAPKQMELLLAFLHIQKTVGEVTQSGLLKKSGATSAQLKGLVEKNILVQEKRRVDRISYLPKEVTIDFELSKEQDRCLNEINEIFSAKNVCLLHGITGSGKTQIYIKLIESYFGKGLQVLYLLPEIALTSQVIRRLQKHFGGNIAIYHSKFNDHERVELWNKVLTGEIRIILGARSSLFLPFKNLGLIIVDEEHDASYKQQDPAPRYNARDAAIYYASIFQSNTANQTRVLLGSATASLESYQNAVQGKYGLVSLHERFSKIQLPEIELVNTRQVVQKAGHTDKVSRGKVMMSPQLQESMLKSLESGKQVILFQNRRGYNPYLICGVCGYLPQCTQCDVSLTLHKYSNKLHCHYCGTIYPKLITCPACGSNDWLEKSFGTEKLEEFLDETFAKYSISRMDVDSVRGKHAHDQLIRQFEEQRVDILVGTQMLVKGLDFDHVGLVGIMDADGLLSYPDFRVNERAFQLMEQVSGRAGRKNEQGKVIIQTLNPEHPVIQLVKKHDYLGLFSMELEKRKEFMYPPFTRLIQLTLKHKDKSMNDRAASRLVSLLQNDFKQWVTGPAAPAVGRIRNQYISEIMIKFPKENDKLSIWKHLLRNHLNLLLSENQFKSVTVVIDVDPY